ncbi:MAG: hypothetical protein IJ987_08055, partial [Firmicutes bacterium]|nr:hypothetical protein [Bacillota bacterium]
MNKQTHKTDGTESSQKEEGRRMTTKSATARSSLTCTHGKHKKIIDAEEQQDGDRLTVDCRISADASILNLISAAGVRNQIGMLMETTAKAARSVVAKLPHIHRAIYLLAEGDKRADSLRSRLATIAMARIHNLLLEVAILEGLEVAVPLRTTEDYDMVF